ncbi:hypothetical protein E1295_36965 [Nonomuraea mesophila]|uniref:Uncharacterized protein n=1 Tax=Nonomuraea mesophila TaxID=2530382 RepID=A0A4R5EJB9_9ACTN|nr:hypothetical protein [Nonomuraea mesophila]TDE34482.1 hypothetical protein E1295_36965 [Nonomuraea mesophila]
MVTVRPRRLALVVAPAFGESFASWVEYFMHEEWGRADLAEQRAEAARLRIIPPRSRRRVLRLPSRFAVTLRRLADHLEPT